MSISFKLESQIGFSNNNVVFSTFQIEQSNFVTLPNLMQEGPRLKTKSAETRNMLPSEDGVKKDNLIKE
ncbi:MAG: hypothetical protein NTX44_07900 [Ignavibacteriales bacterium]|nr:hypothetical protein [Ignavibacteriales bacterium]